MSRDTTLEDRDVPHGSGRDAPSILDRGVHVPALAVTSVAATIGVVAAFILRFTGLDRWPLSISESEIAQSAHNIVRGTTGAEHLVGAPTAVNWTSLFFFAGWSTDSVGRIAMAVAGLLAILLVLLLRSQFGAATAAWSVVLLGTSPTIIATSRRIDGAALLVLLSLVIIAAVLLRTRGQALAWSALAGAATALLALTGPLGVPAAVLAWLAAILLLGRVPAPRLDDLLVGTAAGLAAAVLTTTVFLTRPGSFSASIGELFSRLWDQHLSEIGQYGWLPAFNLLLNEPLLLTLAIVAAVAAPQRALVRTLGIWFLAALVLCSILGDVGSAGYAVVVLPLALLAGAGVAHLVERLPWAELRRGTALIYIIAVLLMAAAAVSLVGLLSGGTGNSTVEWLTRFSLVVIVGVLPLAITISWLGQRLAGDRLVLVLAAGLVLLSALTLRSAVLSSSERPGLSGDPLAAGATSQSVSTNIERLLRVSRDMTMGARSSQDPGGGHGLRIAIDERVQQPFAWYFRDFPHAVVFDPDQTIAPPDADIVILAGARDSRAIAPGYLGESYPFAAGQPDVLRAPDWGGLARGLVSPDAWRSFSGYLINRQPARPAVQQEFQILATGLTAEALFAAKGPFNLDDRPGAGSQPGQLSRPRGVATGPDGSIYVVDSRNARINVYQPDGTYQFSFGSDGSGPGQLARLTTAGAGGASGIAIDVTGNVFVADTWNHRIQVFAADGTYLYGWGYFFDARDDPVASAQNEGAFYGPRGLAFHDGLLYVTDTGNERVQVFQTSGEFVRMFGAPGSAEGQLLEPVGIAISADGIVYIADSHNARIASFNTAGEWLAAIGIELWHAQQFFEPYLTVGPDGNLYTSSSMLGMVLRVDPLTQATTPLAGSELRQPFGLTVAPDGAGLLVTDGIVQAVIRVPFVVP